jgi:hypothetical protein
MIKTKLHNESPIDIATGLISKGLSSEHHAKLKNGVMLVEQEKAIWVMIDWEDGSASSEFMDQPQLCASAYDIIRNFVPEYIKGETTIIIWMEAGKKDAINLGEVVVKALENYFD